MPKITIELSDEDLRAIDKLLGGDKTRSDIISYFIRRSDAISYFISNNKQEVNNEQKHVSIFVENELKKGSSNSIFSYSSDTKTLYTKCSANEVFQMYCDAYDKRMAKSSFVRDLNSIGFKVAQKKIDNVNKRRICKTVNIDPFEM